MKWYNTVIVYVVVAIILTTSVDGRGGRGGGGGRSSGGGGRSRSSGSSRSWFSSSSSSSHSNSHSSGSGGGGGNWFRGVFHSRPRSIVYIPIHSRQSHHSSQSTTSDHTGYSATETAPFADSKQDLAGYSIGKAISSDFFSLFNIVSDISKYTDDRKKYAAANAIETTTEQNISTTNITFTDNSQDNISPF